MIVSSRKHLFTSIMGEAGFTLVELMIALFVSGLVMAAVVSVYTAQTRSYAQQDDIAGIQQNLRGALAILPMEIRMAGCDPTESNVPKILAATRTQ
jgi:type IV pilus assembly protein PilW